MQILRRLALATAALLAAAAPAHAATAPVADFDRGQTVGVGVTGVSWDYGFDHVSLGLAVINNNPWAGPSGINSRFVGGLRGMWRILAASDLSVAPLVGVTFDPGYAGGRSYLIPDLGIGAAYRFQIAEFPLVARFNVSLTVDQGQNAYVPMLSPDAGVAMAPQGNVFQRLIAGPNTMIALGYAPEERFQLILGGGSIVGIRVHY